MYLKKIIWRLSLGPQVFSLILGSSLLLIATLSEASSSRQSVSLDEVLGRTDAAVVVSLAQPTGVSVRIAITPAGEKPDASRWPDFVRRDLNLRIKKVLWSNKGAQPKGVLHVRPGSWQTRLTVHRRYHIEGVRKIPIYPYFKGRNGLRLLHEGEGEAIALLRREGEGGWSMVVDMAFLPTKEQKKVLRRLGARHKVSKTVKSSKRNKSPKTNRPSKRNKSPKTN